MSHPFIGDCRCYSCGSTFTENYRFEHGESHPERGEECPVCGSHHTTQLCNWNPHERWVVYLDERNTNHNHALIPLGTVPGPTELEAIETFNSSLDEDRDLSPYDPSLDYYVVPAHAIANQADYTKATARDELVSLAHDPALNYYDIGQALTLLQETLNSKSEP